jgi:hypothetical protein
MELLNLPVSFSRAFSVNLTNKSQHRYSQIHYWYRCTFPIWSDWTAKWTRKGAILQGVRKAVRLSFLLSVLAALEWLRKNPHQRSQLLLALLAGKDWILSRARSLY